MGTTTWQWGRASLAVGAVALLAAACGGGGAGGSEGDAPMSSNGGVVGFASVDGTDVLVDANGSTLYTTTAEDGGHIKCVGACESFWEPVVATGQQARSASQDLGAKLSVVKRPEGDMQLALGGLPLYTFAEEGAGQLEGDGFVDDFQGTHFEWEAARTDAGSAPATRAPDTESDNGYGY